jgi:acyl carrier protein
VLDHLQKIKYSQVLVALACLGLLLGLLAPSLQLPRWIAWIGLLLLAAILAILGWKEAKAVHRRVDAFLACRESLADDEFGRRFFTPREADIAIRVRRILRPYLHCNVERLHPDDRLVDDLGLGAGDGMDAVEVVMEIEETYGIVLTNEAAAKMLTLRDVVDYVAAFLRACFRSKC